MQGDLISRQDVLKLIEDIKCNDDIPKNYGTLLDIMRQVRNLQTAYDVEKVVAKLEELQTCEDDGTCNHCQRTWCPLVVLDADEVFKIIRNGGKE